MGNGSHGQHEAGMRAPREIRITELRCEQATLMRGKIDMRKGFLLLVVSLLMVAAPAFADNFHPANYTFSTGGNGSVTGVSSSGFTLNGSDTGSGSGADTSYSTTFTDNGTLTFNFSGYTNDWSFGYDPFTIYLNGSAVAPTPINSFSETTWPLTGVSLTYHTGDVLNFDINSLDNLYGASHFTVQDYNQVDTPEPASMILFGSGLLGMAGVVRRKIRK